MPDPIHETTEDGFHEIQLSGKQLVFLFMAMTVILVVTFLSGILVGRAVGTEEPQASVIATTDDPESETPASDAPPPAEPDPPSFTFDDRLRGSGSAPKEELKPTVPPDPTPPPAEPEPVPQKAPEEPTADVPTSGRPGTWFLQLSALSNRAAAADMVRSLVAKGYPAYLQEPSGDALYRVRIGRYRDRSEAEKIAARLKKEDKFSSDIRRN